MCQNSSFHVGWGLELELSYDIIIDDCEIIDDSELIIIDDLKIDLTKPVNKNRPRGSGVKTSHLIK